jgi:hypothetical protein
MVAIIKPNTYPNSVAITISLASLATTVADPPVGRESTEIDNSSNLYEDAIVDFTVKGGTTPTVNKSGNIGVYAVTYDGSTYKRPAGATGSDAGLTLSSAGAYGTLIKVGATFIFNATTGTNYTGSFSVCWALGLTVLPIRWGLFFFHDSVAALDATGGNHTFRYTGINRQLV